MKKNKSVINPFFPFWQTYWETIILFKIFLFVPSLTWVKFHNCLGLLKLLMGFWVNKPWSYLGGMVWGLKTLTLPLHLKQIQNYIWRKTRDTFFRKGMEKFFSSLINEQVINQIGDDVWCYLSNREYKGKRWRYCE